MNKSPLKDDVQVLMIIWGEEIGWEDQNRPKNLAFLPYNDGIDTVEPALPKGQMPDETVKENLLTSGDFVVAQATDPISGKPGTTECNPGPFYSYDPEAVRVRQSKKAGSPQKNAPA